MTIPATARALSASMAGLLVITDCSNSVFNPNQTSTTNNETSESRCFLKTDFVNRDSSASPQLRLARKNGALWAMEMRNGQCQKTLLAFRFNELKDAQGPSGDLQADEQRQHLQPRSQHSRKNHL